MRTFVNANRVRSLLSTAVILTMLLPFATTAAAALKPEYRNNTAAMKKLIQDNAEDLAERSRELMQPTENGVVQALEAVVMQVTGRVQWQSDEEDAEWQAVDIDDVIAGGSRIRTGGNSSVTLRVGKNATVMIDSRSRVLLPEIVQEGDVLRTRAGVERGRADIKLDDVSEVGLINDFSVITPSSTLAVRGTGFAVNYGGLSGTRVTMARFHEMMSVELRYFLTRLTYLLTQGAISTEDRQNPVMAALFRTIGPPPIMSTLVEHDGAPELLAQGFERIAIWQEQKTQIGLAGLDATLNLPFFDPPDDTFPDDPIFDDEFFATLAQFICMNLNLVFENYEVALLVHEVVAFSPEQLGPTFLNIMQYCEEVSVFEAEDWTFILDQIKEFCHSLDLSSDKWHLCVTVFGTAIVEANPEFQNFFDEEFQSQIDG